MKIRLGDCLEEMRTMEDNSVDSIVTDPPYGLSFMGKKWDYDVPSVEIWKECLRVLKPGGYLLSFAGTRTQHRMCCNIEDAGFEIRDMIAWVYGSGFPKSHNIGKAVDKLSERAENHKIMDFVLEEAERQGKTKSDLSSLFLSKNGKPTGWLWNKASHNQTLTNEQFRVLKEYLNLPFESLFEMEKKVIGRGKAGLTKGTIANFAGETEFDITEPTTESAKKYEGWGTALKPALEPITVARKPFKGTVANNVLKWGTGGINIDGCRVEFQSVEDKAESTGKNKHAEYKNSIVRNSAKNGIYHADNRPPENYEPQGRFPSNFCHDGSDEVVGLFPIVGSKSLPVRKTADSGGTGNVYTTTNDNIGNVVGYADKGSAARFFYCAKASKSERNAGCEGLEEKQKIFNGQSDKSSKDLKDVEKRFTTQPSANNHPTVKPLKLMQYLVRLVTPKGGTVLDPFMGSGSTGIACKKEGFDFIGIELDEDYCNIAKARIEKLEFQHELF